MSRGREIVAAWAAVPLDDVGFTIDGVWTYGNLSASIDAALAEAEQRVAALEAELRTILAECEVGWRSALRINGVLQPTPPTGGRT